MLTRGLADPESLRRHVTLKIDPAYAVRRNFSFPADTCLSPIHSVEPKGRDSLQCRLELKRSSPR